MQYQAPDYEKDIESALVTQLHDFLLELGYVQTKMIRW